MNIQTGLHGVSLPARGYKPSQLAERYKQPEAPAEPRLTVFDKLAAQLTDKWQSPYALINAAKLYQSRTSLNAVKKLGSTGVAKTRTIPHGDGFRVQYRKARA